MRAYHRAVHRLLSVVVNTVTALILLQLYGLGGLNWLLTAPLGRRVLAALGTIAITVGLALAVWEAVNAAMQSHLTRLDREANTARSARLRTLLPLMRTTLIVTIGIMSGLMILSEIGVNIAPLLAGAGIVGIAIGFGSQKLVTDLITGVFLLLENAMQVGDVVKVGELIGTVESLSVRTIRLRSEDGSVHVIPFSAVTTVTNMTREFSRTVLQVTVAYDEDYERVVEALRGIVKDMRDAPAWSGIIQDDLEVFGLDRLDTTSLTIRCRIRCTAFGRWSVGREFNRRMKERFAELDIRMPAAPAPARA
jgi:small conductance mechanosensitive channel